MQEYVTEVRWTGRERLVQADRQGAEVLDISERLLDREVGSHSAGSCTACAVQRLQPQVAFAVVALPAHILHWPEVFKPAPTAEHARRAALNREHSSTLHEHDVAGSGGPGGPA